MRIGAIRYIMYAVVKFHLAWNVLIVTHIRSIWRPTSKLLVCSSPIRPLLPARDPTRQFGPAANQAGAIAQCGHCCEPTRAAAPHDAHSAPVNVAAASSRREPRQEGERPPSTLPCSVLRAALPGAALRAGLRAKQLRNRPLPRHRRLCLAEICNRDLLLTLCCTRSAGCEQRAAAAATECEPPAAASGLRPAQLAQRGAVGAAEGHRPPPRWRRIR